ncbi:MAG: hypothetical protein WC376_00415 [Candidatus Nanoarchaeia archaeon]|jgi:hypothetical protein
MDLEQLKTSIRGLSKTEALSTLQTLYSSKDKLLNALSYSVNEEENIFAKTLLKSKELPKKFLSSKAPFSTFYAITENFMFSNYNNIYTFYEGSYRALCEIEISKDGAITEKLCLSEKELKDFSHDIKQDIKVSREMVKKYFSKNTLINDEKKASELPMNFSAYDTKEQIITYTKELSEIKKMLDLTSKLSDLSILLLDIAAMPQENLEEENEFFEFYDLSAIIKKGDAGKDKKNEEQLFYLRDPNVHMIFVKQDFDLMPIYSIELDNYGQISKEYINLLDSLKITNNMLKIKKNLTQFFEESVKEFEKNKIDLEIKNGRQKTLI